MTVTGCMQRQYCACGGNPTTRKGRTRTTKAGKILFCKSTIVGLYGKSRQRAERKKAQQVEIPFLKAWGELRWMSWRKKMEPSMWWTSCWMTFGRKGLLLNSAGVIFVAFCVNAKPSIANQSPPNMDGKTALVVSDTPYVTKDEFRQLRQQIVDQQRQLDSLKSRLSEGREVSLTSSYETEHNSTPDVEEVLQKDRSAPQFKELSDSEVNVKNLALGLGLTLLTSIGGTFALETSGWLPAIKAANQQSDKLKQNNVQEDQKEIDVEDVEYSAIERADSLTRAFEAGLQAAKEDFRNNKEKVNNDI